MSPTDWFGVLTVVALALEYARVRRVDDMAISRIGALEQNLHQETRRTDTVFGRLESADNRLDKLEGRADPE